MADIEKPLSYLQWIRATDVTSVPSSRLFQLYNEYLVNWYKKHKLRIDDFVTFRTSLFTDLLSEIAVNYATDEERHFLSQIDLENSHEMDIVIPFFVKRLKEISQYIITKRHQVRSIKHKQNIKGSELGAANFVKDKVVGPISDNNFTDRHPTANIPALSAVIDYIYIDIETLIDEYDSYFDANYNTAITDYVKDDSEYIAAFRSSTEQIDANIWIDFTAAVTNLISEVVPVMLEINPSATDSAIADSSTFSSIGLNYPRSDIGILPESQFVAGSKTEEDLLLLRRKDLIQKYSGTRMMYLSTGSTATDYVSGVLFDPINKSANYLNRYNASHPSVPSKTHLKSEKDIGRFFTPEKKGLLNFGRIDTHIEIDTSLLSPGTVYIYPDPDEYEPGRGNSKTDTPAIHRYIDDNSKIKESKTSVYSEGDIRNDHMVQKLYPYQSTEETRQLQTTGISRWSDDVDFWEGDKKDIWKNNEIYRKLPLQNFPVQEKEDDLLISSDNVYKWATDIYGNEFALFKAMTPSRKTLDQLNGIYAKHPTQDSTALDNTPVTGLFDYPTPTFFNYQLSGSVTEYESTFNSLTSNKTLNESNAAATDRLFFRNANSTVISPASSALSAVFVKYSTDESIKAEIESSIVTFDIIENIIILETTNHVIIEKYSYDPDANTFSSILPYKVSVSRNDTSSNFEKIAPYWYDERSRQFYITKTVVHPYLSGSNYKAIYPEIYVYDDTASTFSKAFSINTLAPITSSDTYLKTNLREAYNLLSDTGFTISKPSELVSTLSGVSINITSIDKPTVNINSYEYTLSLNYMGIDQSGIQYLFNQYYDVRDYKNIAVKKLDMFVPNMNIFNHNLSHYNTIVTDSSNTLSGFVESSELNRGGPEYKIITFDSLKQSVVVGDGGQLVTYPVVYSGSVSGRNINPDAYVDLSDNIIRMGAGLSASS